MPHARAGCTATRRGWCTLNLRGVSFQNFKSFRGETAIPLGQITCLIGPNGAGKSNVLHGMKTLAAVLADDYAPEPGDYFDNNTDLKMALAATVELSDKERKSIASRMKTRPTTLSRSDIGDWLFKHLNYKILFSGGTSKTHTISMTHRDAKYRTFVNTVFRNDNHTAKRRNIELIDIKSQSLPKLELYGVRTPAIADVFEQVDETLLPRMRDLFSGIIHVTTQRSIPESTPVNEGHGITPDGSNSPNELNSLSRSEQLEFDRYLSGITDGSISTVEPRVRGSEMVLEATEPDLSRRTPRSDFSSGQEQMILLARHMFGAPSSIFMVSEPELHLHAKAQRQVYAMLRRASAKTQIIIETHSPTFLGTDQNETVLLVTKDQGQSHAVPISPDNVGVIRRELGVTHHDALSHTNILFVEGDSEYISFPKFLSTLGYKIWPKTAIFNLGGAGKIKHLRLLLSYFKADGRKAFVVLDDNRKIQPYIAQLKKNNLIDRNFFVLEKNFEDAFAPAVIMNAVGRMAQRFECQLDLTEAVLSKRASQGERVDAILQKYWRNATGYDFNKVDLANLLAELPPRDIPKEIKAALRAAMGYFELDSNGELAKGDNLEAKA